jgi:hypothetical protein
VLARAKVVFDANPSTSTTAPHAVITHQIACVAVAKSVPRARLAATTVPDTATPSAAPTWRFVDAITAATPAFDLGAPAVPAKPATPGTGDTVLVSALTDADGLFDSFMNSLLQVHSTSGMVGSAAVIQGRQVATLESRPDVSHND